LDVNDKLIAADGFDFIFCHDVEHIALLQQLGIGMRRKDLTAPHFSFHTPIGIAYP
jgi:hypothetical protein